MTPKQKFLENLMAKIKLYQDAYDYNKGLPDDLFDSLNGTALSVPGEKLVPPIVDNEYGANINAVRDIIAKAGHEGIPKSKIIQLFPYKDGKEETVVTNALSSLNKAKKIEGIKPKGITIKGFYWRIKA